MSEENRRRTHVGGGQAKPWRREISPCGSARRIPQGSLRQITEIFRILPYPSSFLHSQYPILLSLAPFSPVHRSHPPSVIPSLSPPAGSLARPLRQPVLRLVRSVSLTSCWVHALPLTAAMVPLLPANGVESCSIVSFSGAIRHCGRGQVPVHLH